MLKLIIGIILLFLVLISAHFVFVEGEERLTLENLIVQENFDVGSSSNIIGGSSGSGGGSQFNILGGGAGGDGSAAGETYDENQFIMDCYGPLSYDGNMEYYSDRCCRSFLENEQQFLQNYSNYLQNNEWERDCVDDTDDLKKLHKKIVLKCVNDADFNGNVLLENGVQCRSYLQDSNINFRGIDRQLNDPGLYGCMIDEQCELSSREVNRCFPSCYNDVKINKIEESCDIHGDCYNDRHISNSDDMCGYIQNQYNCDRTEGCQYDYDNNYCKSSNPSCGELNYEFDCTNNDDCIWNSNQYGGYCQHKNQNCSNYITRSQCNGNSEHCLWQPTSDNNDDPDNNDGSCLPNTCGNINNESDCNANDNCIYVTYEGANNGMCADKKAQCSFRPNILTQSDRDRYCKRVCESIQENCSIYQGETECNQIDKCEYSSRAFTCEPATN